MRFPVPRPAQIVRILIDYRPALRARTGAGFWIAGLVEALATLDAPHSPRVTIFSSSWKDRLGSVAPSGVAAMDRRVPGRLLNWLWHRREWPPIEQFTGEPFDVVHSPSPLLIPSRTAARLVTIHDLDFLDHPERSVREIRRDYADLARAHARRADAVVVSSETTADEVIRRLNVAPQRLTVCPVGAPPWSPRPPSSTGRHILFVGTLGARKNVGGLITAYTALRAGRKDAPPLVLAGEPGPDPIPELEAQGEDGVIRRLDYVQPTELRKLYESAVMLVLPSFDEGFGIPVLEAMTVGVPVVVSNRGSLPEVVGEAGVIVDPEDTHALAAAMANLLDDHERYARLVKAGVAQATRFRWARSATALLGAYHEAYKRRRGEAPDADRS
ncbi:MAG: hypothetical protein CL483_05075 [Acidobacteria bacterium]|nr:hypothetical protein [Acidobacteriota bacterium]